MLKKTIHQLLRHRHFWRDVGFDELSELYMSVMLRSFSVNMTGIFVPLYMLQLGYSLTEIMMVVAWYFTFRWLFCDLLSAYTTAKIGPKHTMLIGYGLLTCSTAMFLVLPSIAWPIWLLGGVWGASMSFFFIPFHVDFSKIKHSRHGGKELGYVTMMDKLGQTLGPVMGGILASIFAPQYIFLVATAFLLISVSILMRTAEPVRLNQRLDFKSLKVDKLKRDFISVVGFGIENTLTMFLWPLYLAIFILAGSAAYLKLGVLASASIVVAILSAYVIGKLIDQRHGRILLRSTAVINAIVHLARPLMNSYPSAFATSVVNDTITVGYRMPYFKGLYDAADDLPGYRIVYIASMEIISSMAKATVWWLFVILSAVVSGKPLFVIGFIVAAIASLVIMAERFRALAPIKYNVKHK